MIHQAACQTDDSLSGSEPRETSRDATPSAIHHVHLRLFNTCSHACVKKRPKATRERLWLHSLTHQAPQRCDRPAGLRARTLPVACSMQADPRAPLTYSRNTYKSICSAQPAHAMQERGAMGHHHNPASPTHEGGRAVHIRMRPTCPGVSPLMSRQLYR
jgi:hypothetical protein